MALVVKSATVSQMVGLYSATELISTMVRSGRVKSSTKSDSWLFFLWP